MFTGLLILSIVGFVYLMSERLVRDIFHRSQ